jgi:hypothetical protein
MPTDHETYRNGRLRLAVVLTILLSVALTLGWSSLLGWPALVLAADVLVTAGWLLRLRYAAGRRTPRVQPVTAVRHRAV